MSDKQAYTFAVALLLLLFALLILGARPISLTSDEPAHLVAGYSILTRGAKAFWILPQHGHPPLLNVLNALIFYIGKPAIPLETLDGWPLWFSDYVFAFIPYLAPVQRTELVIRVPTIWLTMVLGALVFRWSKELWGKETGLLALLVLVFDPLLLAHGRLATTDVGSVTLGTSVLYLAWRWAERPSWRLTWLIGLMCGLTMLAKGSGIFWTLAVGLIVAGTAVSRRSRSGWIMILQGICIGLLGLLLVWAGHAFTWGIVREDLPISLPAPDYWNGIISQARSVEKRWVFAVEMRTHGGWWWYFPMAFLIKNPLPLLIGLGIGLLRSLRRPFSWSRFSALGIFPLIYTLAAIRSGMNIGYRHMLPVHPIIYLVAGAGVWTVLSRPSRRWWWYGLILILGLWYLTGTLRMFGYEIAYFNELIGGPRNGHRYLIDSNIDWGQGYKDLRDYLRDHPGPTLQLSRGFLNIDPGQYGISFQPLPPDRSGSVLTAPLHPLPGRYAISITILQRGWPEDPDMYAWFRQIKPTAEIGYSFFLYDIHPSPLKWIAQCSVPAVALSDSVIERGFGSRGLRRVDFDCTSGWIYPFGGAQPGVYSFHNDLLKERKRTFPSFLPAAPEFRDPFIIRRLSQGRLSVDMNRYTPDHPAFVLYEQERAPDMPGFRRAIPFSADTVPGSEVFSVTAPIALNGPLVFLGVNAIRTGSGLDVETWWRVTEGPITRPLSVMGHLLNGAGEVFGQDDGLAVSPVLWQPGDIIVQRHRFTLPHEIVDSRLQIGEELWLRTGVYWLDTMERWAIVKAQEKDTLWIPLPMEGSR